MPGLGKPPLVSQVAADGARSSAGGDNLVSIKPAAARSLAFGGYASFAQQLAPDFTHAIEPKARVIGTLDLGVENINALCAR